MTPVFEVFLDPSIGPSCHTQLKLELWNCFPCYKNLLEQAPQGIGAAKPVRMSSTLTQIHPILPKSNQNLDLEPLNVDLMSDLVNPCAIRAAGGRQ